MAMFYHKFLFKLYESAARRKILDLKNFIDKGSSIIDVGCGSGILANELSRAFDAKITGVDIVDVRIYKVPFKLIDGKHMPFPDNTFDDAIIAYVLHHAEDPVQLLKETRRVAKKRIFVYEDIPEGLITKIFARMHGLLFDAIYKPDNKTKHKVGGEWRRIFKEIGFKLVEEKRVATFINQRLFVLEKI